MENDVDVKPVFTKSSVKAHATMIVWYCFLIPIF